MSTKKWVYILSGLTIFAVLSAAILMYVNYKGTTNFVVVSAPKQEDVNSPIKIEKAEVNFAETELGNNIALDKKITENSHTQVYVGKNAVDGDAKTYWEGAPDSYPNILILDLESPEDVDCVRIKLNPNNMWERRKQNISIYGGQDSEEYIELSQAADYIFDPLSGNAVIINFNSTSIRYLKLEFNSNTAATGGQAAEIEVY